MSHPGCSFDGCAKPAAYRAVHDDRLTGQWLCFEHAIHDLNQALNEHLPEVDP